MKNLLIIHGWGRSSKEWEENVQYFSSFFHIYNYDLPGFGAEPLIDRSFNVPNYADWLAAKLPSNKTFHIVGHSFGGRIATELAYRKLIKVEKLVLYAAPVIYKPKLSTKIIKTVAPMIKHLVPKRLRSSNPEYESAKQNNLAYTYQQVVTYDQRSQLSKVKNETLILWGNQDSEARVGIAYEADKLLPNSKLKVFKNKGHNIHLKNKELFNKTIVDFLQ